MKNYVKVNSAGQLEVDGKQLFADPAVRRQVDILAGREVKQRVGVVRSLADQRKIRINELEAENAELRLDKARLDELEKLVAENPGGLLIHHQTSPVKWTGCGLGLSHWSLRKAIDDATHPIDDAVEATR